MDVSYACAATATIVWIVSYREKSYAVFKISGSDDLPVEVMDDRDVESSGTGVDPIFAELISVPGVHWLDCVAEIVQNAGEGFERPAIAALRFPYFAVILERSERDESVV